jgi:phosphoribosylaminoimidazole-succinocarboxamide synthase
MTAVVETKLDLPLFIKGKVREVYDLGDRLLLVSSDRISAYDYVLGTLVPEKGKVLNQISTFWFHEMKGIVKNHLIETDVKRYPAELKKYEKELEGRSALVWKTEKLQIECVVRGYLSGSGWKEYQQNGKVCGVPLPAGLKESEKLPEPIFTPATKEEGGKHDQNISFDEMAKIVGLDLSRKLKDISIAIFNFGSKVAESRGLILADTKFEFGLLKNAKGEKEIILIDECLTPDSSRYWEKSVYKVGSSPASFDKQFVRDYLDSIKWDRQPPVPSLPEDVVQKTRAKYIEAFKRITGKENLD